MKHPWLATSNFLFTASTLQSYDIMWMLREKSSPISINGEEFNLPRSLHSIFQDSTETLCDKTSPEVSSLLARLGPHFPSLVTSNLLPN